MAHSPLCVQVLILLLFSRWLVGYLWDRGYDPDSYMLPFITALGDVVGTVLLTAAFCFLWAIGDRDTNVGD